MGGFHGDGWVVRSVEVMGPGTAGELGAIRSGSGDERQWKDASPDSVGFMIEVIDNTCVMVEDGRTVGWRGSQPLWRIASCKSVVGQNK